MRRALIALALCACAKQPVPHDEPAVTSRVEQFEWPGLSPGKLDILFVIDDSAEMAPYTERTQAMLRAVEGLWPGTPWSLRPSLHVAVTTADPSGAGQLQLAPVVNGAFLVDEPTPDGLREVNYAGTMADALAMLGAVGTNGAGAVPLANARAALENAAGFLRPEAYLAVVIVSAHDDASAVPVSDAIAWAKGLKTDPNSVVAVLVAPATAPRLRSFVAAFPNREMDTVIDDADYTYELSILGQLYKVALGSPCLAEPLDLDPETSGAQYDCEVELVQSDGVVQIVPPCPGPLCWQYVPDPQNCIDGPGGEIAIPPYRWYYPTTLRGQCVVGN